MHAPSSRCCVRAARRSSGILRPACSLDADQLRHAVGTLVAAGPRDVGRILRTARARVAAHGRPAAPIGARASPAAGPPSRATPSIGRARRRGRDAGTGAAAALRRRLPPAADARRPTPRHGVNSRASTAGSKRAARFAAAGSSPACRASSSRCPTRSSGCAKSAARRLTARLITISAADPLNLAGIVTAGDRIRAAGRTRIVYRDGAPVAVMEGDFVRDLSPLDPAAASAVARALRTRRTPAQLV